MSDLFVPLDVNTPDDPKIMAAGDRAELLFYRALCLAKRIQSDGFIASTQLVRPLGGKPADARRLVDVGLWRVVDGGWQIVAWLKRNPSRSDLDTRRDAEAERKRKWRDARATGDMNVADERDTNGTGPSPPNGATHSELDLELEHSPKGAAAPPNGQSSATVPRLVAGYVADYEATHDGRRPAERFIKAAGRNAKELLAEGFDADELARCLGAIAAENKNPQVLANVIGDLHSRSGS